MEQKGSLKQMRTPSRSTTKRTTHGFSGASKAAECAAESSGKRFFKRKKGKSNLADDNPDAWQTTDGQWQDSQWQDQYWDDWSWYESEESYAAKGKGKKGKKGKGKGKYSKDGKDGKSGRMDSPNLPKPLLAVLLLLRPSMPSTSTL